MGDLIGKIPRSLEVSASASTKNILKISVKNIPSGQIIDGFKTAINRASLRIAVDLKLELDGALRSSVWRTPGGVSDIYDTGELLASGRVTVGSDGVTVSYDAPYAALVHYGGYINPYGNTSARVYLPPRPWVDSVLNGGGPVPAFDFASYYRQEIEQEFS